MSDFDRPGATLPGPVEQRPKGSRFANLSDRLARTFGGYERSSDDTQAWDPPNGYGYEEEGDPPGWDPVGPRFPLARLGYDRAAVDEHIAELERELADLQTRAPSEEAVSAEIDRIGEQTSAILTVAHDQAHEMTRQAQEQADRCLADAASNAVMITEGAKRRLREIDNDTDVIWRERARLVEDVRSVSAALSSLADDAVARFPAEPAAPQSDASEMAEGPENANVVEDAEGRDADDDHGTSEPSQTAEPEQTGTGDGEQAVPSASGASGVDQQSPDRQATVQMPATPEDDQPWFGS